jgi:L-asparagine transporter-like permease
LIIAISQVVLRRKLNRTDPESLTLKMWLFPWLSYATIGLMVVVIAAMAVLPSTRSQFLMSGLTLLLILVSYQIRKVLRARRTAGADATAEKSEMTPVSPTP